jgi:DNA-binding NarL/FixJ family response regulator
MHATSPITVASTRFEDLLALGVQAALERDPSVTLVARDIEPGRIGVMLRAHRPRVLILDVAALRDLAQVGELSAAHPATRLVVLGHGLSSADSAQVLAFGASACLSKDTQARDLLHAVHLASRGLQLQPMPAGDGAATVRSSLLTPREGDVLFLLRQDRSNAQIALALQIGVETVRSHARNIYRKLGVSSRRALMALPAAAAGEPLPAPQGPEASARRRPARPVAPRRDRHR